MHLKMIGGIVARSSYRGVINSWSDQQWAALAPEERPEGAIRVGPGWVELAPDGWPGSASPAGVDGTPGPSDMPRRGGDGTGPVSWPSGARGHHLPPECVIVDPASPAVREFLHRATLEGLIRTAPAGPRRVLVLPSSLWSRGGPRPDARR